MQQILHGIELPTLIQNEGKRFKRHKIVNLRRLRGFHPFIYAEDSFSGKGIPNDPSATIGSICVFFPGLLQSRLETRKTREMDSLVELYLVNRIYSMIEREKNSFLSFTIFPNFLSVGAPM